MVIKGYWHWHHDILCEFACTKLTDRRQFIRKHKESNQVETRLRLLHRMSSDAEEVLVRLTAYMLKQHSHLYDPYMYRLLQKPISQCKHILKQHHKKECPGCPWDGHTIFPYNPTIT